MAGIVFYLIFNLRDLRQLNKVGWSIVKAIEDCSSFPCLDRWIDEVMILRAVSRLVDGPFPN